MENFSCFLTWINRQHDDIYVDKFDKEVCQFRKKVHSWLSEQSKEDQNQEKSEASSEKRSSHSSRKSSRKSSRTSSRAMKDRVKKVKARISELQVEACYIEKGLQAQLEAKRM